MKSLLKCGGFLLIMASPFALAQDAIIINGQSVTVTLSDNNQAQITSCKDFIGLHNAGETIKAFPGLSDRDYQDAKLALTNCWIDAWAIKNGYTHQKDSPYSLADIMASFPASAALAVNDDEVKENQKAASKTFKEFYPDLKADGENFVSASASVGYHLLESKSFINAKGKKVYFITLTGYVTDGTLASPDIWRIDDTTSKPWKVSIVDFNTTY